MTTEEEQALLAKAARDYPDGTKYIGLRKGGTCISNRPVRMLHTAGTQGIEVGVDYVYFDNTGQWAIIVSLPKPEVISTYEIF